MQVSGSAKITVAGDFGNSESRRRQFVSLLLQLSPAAGGTKLLQPGVEAPGKRSNYLLKSPFRGDTAYCGAQHRSEFVFETPSRMMFRLVRDVSLHRRNVGGADGERAIAFLPRKQSRTLAHESAGV